jgi:hypothetical protein
MFTGGGGMAPRRGAGIDHWGAAETGIDQLRDTALGGSLSGGVRLHPATEGCAARVQDDGILRSLAFAAPCPHTRLHHLETNGTERRGERHENRNAGREEKAASKAGDENSRAECRQDKRDTKQETAEDSDKGDSQET